ncbi:MAG: hypothetical protein RR904_07010 [Bacilli bacterium]
MIKYEVFLLKNFLKSEILEVALSETEVAEDGHFSNCKASVLLSIDYSACEA